MTVPKKESELEKRIKDIERQIVTKKREISKLQFELSDLRNQKFCEDYNKSGVSKRRALLRG